MRLVFWLYLLSYIQTLVQADDIISVFTPQSSVWIGGDFVEDAYSGLLKSSEQNPFEKIPNASIPKAAGWVNSIRSFQDRVMFAGDFIGVNHSLSPMIAFFNTTSHSYIPSRPPFSSSGVVNATSTVGNVTIVAGSFAGDFEFTNAYQLDLDGNLVRPLEPITFDCASLVWSDIQLAPGATPDNYTMYGVGSCYNEIVGKGNKRSAILASYEFNLLQPKWHDIYKSSNESHYFYTIELDSRYLYIGGHFDSIDIEENALYNGFFQYDRLKKQPLNMDFIPNNPVSIFSILLLGENTYLGGIFSYVSDGNLMMNNLAHHNRTAGWHYIGSPMIRESSRGVTARVLGIMSGKSESEIIVYGEFTMISVQGRENMTCNGIATYDRAADRWSLLGDDVTINPYPSFIYQAVMGPDGRVYSVGQRWEISQDSVFFPVGFLRPVSYDFSENAWQYLSDTDDRGFYTTGKVYAFARNGDHLYIGGDFADMGSEETKTSFNIIEYDALSTNFTSMGKHGLANGTVNAIYAMSDEEVLVVGTFNTRYEGRKLNSVGRWNRIEKTWDDMGGGIKVTEPTTCMDSGNSTSAVVTASDVDSTHLYVAGNFDGAGDQTNPYSMGASVARYDRVQRRWQFLPLNLSRCNIIRSIKLNGTIMYVAGAFRPQGVPIHVPPEAKGNPIDLVMAYDLEHFKWLPHINVTVYCRDGPSRINTMEIVNLDPKDPSKSILLVAGRFLMIEKHSHDIMTYTFNGNTESLGRWGASEPTNSGCNSADATEIYSLSTDPLTNELYVGGKYGSSLDGAVKLPYRVWSWSSQSWNSPKELNLKGWRGTIRAILPTAMVHDSLSLSWDDSIREQLQALLAVSFILLIISILVAGFVTHKAISIRRRFNRRIINNDEGEGLRIIEDSAEISLEWKEEDREYCQGVWNNLNVTACVKTMALVNGFENQQFFNRFIDHMQDMIHLRHVNVLQYVAISFTEEGEVIILSEGAKGGDLATYVANAVEDKHSVRYKLEVMSDIAEGIKYIHSKDVAHGNIRPTNIFLVNRRAKLAFPGLFMSVPLLQEDTEYQPEDAVYLAPEVMEGEVTMRSDLYSFGVLLALVYLNMTQTEFEQCLCKTSTEVWKEMESKYPQQILLFVKSCLNTNPLSRPHLRDIIWMLDEEKRRMI
ncbi:hypothetical protein PROFUN_00380 [Planoprotostelium fungivorum]|uniref:Protein kinase domain-containing protein n=1 Tax=Planoprotostelium fungivorum TaxID=1890364 RepID=A0A2P6NYA7_9EUKA|nr:hypothetical protein PROFUN_00380 [Planoprotostelium fungivorum]